MNIKNVMFGRICSAKTRKMSTRNTIRVQSRVSMVHSLIPMEQQKAKVKVYKNTGGMNDNTLSAKRRASVVLLVIQMLVEDDSPGGMNIN